MRHLLIIAAIVGIALTGCEKKEEVLEYIEVTTQPAKKEYFVGEPFDPEGMVVTATYSDETTAPIDNSELEFEYDFNDEGTKTVTVRFSDKGKTATTTVTGITVAELEPEPKPKPEPVTLESIEVTTQPAKKEYFVSEPFDPVGMVVTATYSDKSTAPIDISELEFDYDFDGDGIKTVTVSFSEKGETATTTVTGITVAEPEPVTLESIEVTTQPTNKEYLVNEPFDPVGMVVAATYSDNSTVEIIVNSAILTYDFSVAGANKTVIITYEGKTATVTGITVNNLFAGGNGLSAATAYEINTPEQLALLAELVNEGNTYYNDKYYKLTADINLSNYGAGFNGGKGWIPIGDYANDKPFRGNFDGAGNKVSRLYINDNTLSSAGLLGYVRNGTIANIGVIDVDIKGNNLVGGIAGLFHSGGIITNCYVRGAVSGNGFVGGMAGMVSGGSSVTNCYTATVIESNGYGNVGGVVGIVQGSSVTNCYATGAVSGMNIIGGVAGAVENGGSITNCYATGTVSGLSQVGGVAGYSSGSITNCAALNPSITRVGSSPFFGRVAGYVDASILNDNLSFAYMEAIGGITFGAGAHNNKDGEDITAAQAKQKATYMSLDWDFTNVWKINEGAGYPKLQWEK